jgi:transcriptional regulator with XRE-family HTH domain
MPHEGDARTNPKVFLGNRLRRARIAAGFNSQDLLAVKLGFDRTVITKAETGGRVPTPDVLAAWCEACGLDAELYGDIAELARSSDGPIPAWFEYWLERERTAHMLRFWSPIIVTPLFETAEYRRAVVMAGGNDLERAEELVAATLERQSVLSRVDPPEVVAVLHETVLHRLIGSPEIMHDQLTHLADSATRPNISVHVVPSSAGAHAGLSGDISLASGDGEPDVLHTDAVPEGHTTETRSLVRRAAVTFERVRRDALPCAQSRDLILRTADELWKS